MSVSLDTLITSRKISTRVMALMQQQAVSAITRAREEGDVGAIDARSFVFSDDMRTLTIYPISKTYASEGDIIAAYGQALLDAVIASPNHPKRLIAIAEDCMRGHIHDLDDLDLRLEKRLSNTIYLPIIVIILIALLLLWALR